MDIHIDDSGMRARFSGIEKRMTNALPFFRSADLVMRRSIMKNFQQGGRPRKWKTSTSEAYGRKTMSITGRLKQSIVYTATPHELVIGTNLVYARLMQYGGTVKPKARKFLAIPISKEAFGKRPRDFEGLRVVKSKRGSLILARVMRDGEIRPMFALLKSITVPARPFLVFQREDIRSLKRMYTKYVLENR